MFRMLKLHNKNAVFSMINLVIIFGWIMSFPYEGPVMYALLRVHEIDSTALNTITVFFIFLGLFFGRFIAKNIVSAKKLSLCLQE